MRMLAQADSDTRERAILALTSNRPIRGEVAQQWQAIQRERPVRRGDVMRQLYAASCYKPPLKVPKMPTLVLTSYRDRLTDWRCSRDLAKALECPLELHPDAGHDLPLDDSPWLIEQLNAYFPVDECVQARTD